MDLRTVTAALQAPQARSGTFEAPPPGWWRAIEAVGPFVLLAALAFLVARALVRRHRYRAVAVLDEADRAAVREALTEAERATTGEIIAVVLERSDRHPGACWLAAVVTVLAGTAILDAVLPWPHAAWLVLLQAGLAGIGYAIACLLPDVKRTFVSAARATEVAEEQAFQEFHRQGLHRTRGATGVLIFVSLLEHRVVVLADEGIAKGLPPDHWAGVCEAILAGIRTRSLRDGLVAGIRAAGEVLVAHAPAGPRDPDELPDHLVVRRE